MSGRTSLFALAAAMVLTGPALAHHSFAMFDQVAEIVLQGTVSQFQWTNPHTWIELDVPNDKGEVVHWSIEGGSTLGLSREGWHRTTLQRGDKITLVAHPLKDGSHGGSLMGVTLANGQHLGASIRAEAPAK